MSSKSKDVHPNKNKEYLKAWVGSNSSSLHKNLFSQNPLVLSGSSYLLPTLRLDRDETADSLIPRLEGKNVENFTSSIVLDLSAFSPDGSHHYLAPKKGFLTDVVNILGKYGIAVLGLTGSLSKELEEENVQKLALPLLTSRVRAWDKQNNKNNVRHVKEMMKKRSKNNQSADLIVDENFETSKPSINGKTENSYTNANILERKASSDINSDLSTIPSTSTIFHGSVRSGQQVYSKKGHSLVVMGSVNSGGEVLSDGDIFVFGKLLGRALAGLSWKNSRIIATSFDPELVSVGGKFTTIDRTENFGIKSGEPAIATCDKNGDLIFESISL